MTKRSQTKLVHEGHYVAEVSVELIEDENGWSPYLSLDDAGNWTKSGRHYAARI